MTSTRRQFLQTTLAATLASAGCQTIGRNTPHQPERFFYTSQGKTFMMNADGTGLRTFDFDVPNQATWQPAGFFSDGHRVLFLSMEPRRDGPGKPFSEYYHLTPTHLWTYDLDRDVLTEIATQDRMAVFYTPQLLLSDDRLLVQVVRDKEGQVFSMNLDGSDARPFTQSGEGMPYGFNLSPDGQRVAYHIASPSGYQIWTSDIEGQNRTRVAADKDHLFFCPCWSPCGEWLIYQDCLFQQDPGHDWSDVWLSRPDGTGQRLLTHDQALWFAASYGSPENHGNGSNTPNWSHDGKVLCAHRLPGTRVPWAYQSNRPDTDHFNRDFKPEQARGGVEICRIDPQTSRVERLTQSEPPVWDFRQSESHSGRYLLFCRAETGGSPAIWIASNNGENPRLLTKGLDDKGADHPQWLPLLR